MTDRKEHERELQRKERRYQAVFNDPNILVGLIDVDGTVLDINRTAMAYVDASPDEITGTPFWETPWFDHSAAVRDEVRDWIDRAASGEYVEFEADLARPNGERYTVEGVFRPVTNDDGEVVSLLISDRDITDQKRRERDYETMARRLEAILDNTTTPIFMKDDGGRYIFVNRGYRDLFGLEDADIVGRTDAELHPPAVAEQVRRNDELVLDRGETVESEERIVADGTEHVFLSTKVPIYDTGDRFDPDRPVAVFGVASDITTLKERERRLRETTSRLEVLFDNSPDMIDVLDPTGRLRDVNSRFCEELGYDEDEVLGRPIWEIDPTVDADDVSRLLSDFAPDERRMLEGRYERRDGSTFPVEVHLLRLDIEGEDRFLAISRDIADRKETERRLQAERQFVQSVFDALPDPLYAFDTDGYPIRWNDQLETVTGYAGDEVAETHITELVPEGEAETVARNFRGVLETREPVAVESAFETKDGERIPYEFTGGPLEDADGTLRGVTGIGRDLVARKERERRLTALNDVAHDLVAADSREEVAEMGVEAARDVLGLEANAIHLYDEERAALVPIAATDTVDDLIGDVPTFTAGDSIGWRAYERGETSVVNDVRDDPDVYDPETPIRSELHLPLGDYGILIAGSETREAFDRQDRAFGEILAGGITAALEQVEQTERVRARKRELTRQNERLEEFASVVSHDLQNPLTVAEGRLALAREERDSEHLRAVDSALERMDTLIADLLTLAREGEQVGELRAVDLERLTATSWRHVATAEATLTTDLDRRILADESRLRQLLENLMRNAVEHGDRDVTVAVGELEDGFYVEDDGSGISEDERDDVFTPGYSTSRDGTGFGLSIVEQVAHAHGWDVRVTDGPDGGARFELTGVGFADP
ncbi:MAG: PAS domain S-box protein [Haloferacaceae archaeon]